MKKRISILAIILMVCFAAAALAGGTVKITGDQVNVRKAPNLDGAKLGVVVKGDTLTYTGTTSTDDRGVRWFSVNYGGKDGWVSERYSQLNNSGSAGSAASESFDVMEGWENGLFEFGEIYVGRKYEVELDWYVKHDSAAGWLTIYDSAGNRVVYEEFYTDHGALETRGNTVTLYSDSDSDALELDMNGKYVDTVEPTSN